MTEEPEIQQVLCSGRVAGPLTTTFPFTVTAQPVERPTLDFSSCHEPRVVAMIEPCVRLCTKHGACLGFSPFPSAPPLLMFSLSKIKRIKTKQNKKTHNTKHNKKNPHSHCWTVDCFRQYKLTVIFAKERRSHLRHALLSSCKQRTGLCLETTEQKKW